MIPSMNQLSQMFSSRLLENPRGRQLRPWRPRGFSPTNKERTAKHHRSSGKGSSDTPQTLLSKQEEPPTDGQTGLRRVKRQRIIGLSAFPAYIAIPGINPVKGAPSQGELIRGTSCKFIMELLAEGMSWKKIVREISSNPQSWSQHYRLLKLGEEGFKVITQTCKSLGLSSWSPLESDDWENEMIEGWWIKDTGVWEEERRQEPIGDEIAGNPTSGWWSKLEDRANRDWERWPEREIGPRKRKRRT